VIEGDSITEVLSYVQYDKQDLMRRIRSRLEGAVRAGKVNMKESALLLRRYEQGLAAYTYLADDDLEDAGDPAAAEATVQREGTAHADRDSSLHDSPVPPA
jgi:hypothetical protein